MSYEIAISLKKFHELSLLELYEILRLRQEVFAVEQQINYQDCDGFDPCAIHVYMKSEDKFIGYLRVLPPRIKFDGYTIGRVLVCEKFRLRGYSKNLLNFSVNYIKKQKDCSEGVYLSAQSYLEKFYLQMGFNAISGHYMLEGVSHIDMNRFFT